MLESSILFFFIFLGIEDFVKFRKYLLNIRYLIILIKEGEYNVFI